MARQKKEPNRLDELLDELLEDCHSPEDMGYEEYWILLAKSKRGVPARIELAIPCHLKR